MALGGFLAKQIREYVSGRDSLGIRNIHVFYSFDDPDSDKSVHKETECLQESMLLIQPNITYTQIPIKETLQLMMDSMYSSYEIAQQYIGLIQQIYFTSSDEVQEMLLEYITRVNSELPSTSGLFSDQILNAFILNTDPTKLDRRTMEYINKFPESDFRNIVIKSFEMLDNVLRLELSSDIDEKNKVKYKNRIRYFAWFY